MKHKVFKIIEVPSDFDENHEELCVSDEGETCMYFRNFDKCREHKEECRDKQIIYLKVELND